LGITKRRLAMAILQGRRDVSDLVSVVRNASRVFGYVLLKTKSQATNNIVFIYSRTLRQWMHSERRQDKQRTPRFLRSTRDRQTERHTHTHTEREREAFYLLLMRERSPEILNQPQMILQ